MKKNLAGRHEKEPKVEKDVFSESESNEKNHKGRRKSALQTIGFLVETGVKSKFCVYFKLAFFILVWLLITVLLIIEKEPERKVRMVNVPAGDKKVVPYSGFKRPKFHRVAAEFEGPFVLNRKSDNEDLLTVYILIKPNGGNEISLKEQTIGIYKNLDSLDNERTEWELLFELSDEEFEILQRDDTNYDVVLSSNIQQDLPLSLRMENMIAPPWYGILTGSLILFLLYFLIIFDVVHRTFAAMIASSLSVAALSYTNDRPTMTEMVGHIEAETLLLLFSMMIIVAIIAKTGLFDYAAVFAYQVTGGRVWPLINYLCLFTGLLSMFLDNVTTVLLMTPIIIRICEVADLNPTPILIIVIMSCNVAGVGTPMGDPPNIMIISNDYLRSRGISFGIMTMHLIVGVIFCMAGVYVLVRFVLFRNEDIFKIKEHPEITELKREIKAWKQAVQGIPNSYSAEEDVIHQTIDRKILHLEQKLNRKLHMETLSKDIYMTTLLELKNKFPIRDKILLVKSMVILAAIVLMFFLKSVPGLHNLSFGWTAFLGLVLLILVSKENDMDHYIHQVEWATLLFFACLFILMENLTALGLIKEIAQIVQSVIVSVEKQYQTTIAIVLIIWVAGIMSSIVDNIPLTSMMLKILASINDNPKVHAPLLPLVLSLAFAGGFGGNGTLIASSPNIVGAGVAEAHGYKITFIDFFKIGMPVTLCTLVLANIYLILCHVALSWH